MALHCSYDRTMSRDGTTSIAQHILDGMKATGIRQLFCLPGVQNDPFFDAVVDARDWLEVIVTRHEQGCAYMAMGRQATDDRPHVRVPGPGSQRRRDWRAPRGGRLYWLVGRSIRRARKGIRVLHDLDYRGGVASCDETFGDRRYAGRAQQIPEGSTPGLRTPRPFASRSPLHVAAPASGAASRRVHDP